MPCLDWIGKDKVINHHRDVPFKVLNRKYSFDKNGESENSSESENMIIKGDNIIEGSESLSVFLELLKNF